MNYVHEQCQCPAELCARGVNPPADCVARLDFVESTHCDECDGDTLHHQGECIRCKRKERDAQAEATVAEPPKALPAPSAPAIVLSINLGSKPIEVADPGKVKRILKILMEG